MAKTPKPVADEPSISTDMNAAPVDWTFQRFEFPPLFSKSAFENMAKIGSALQGIAEQITAVMAPLSDLFRGIAFDLRRAERIEAAGWLPHYTTPFDLIGDETPVERIGAIVEQHYRENWSAAETAFLERLEVCQVDEEAKATFRDALAAHRHGLFRSVPRTLFPEIERVACAELYDGSRTYPRKGKNGKAASGGIASLPDFAETVGKLPLGGVLTTDYGLALYLKLREHLYQPVHSPDEVARAVDDSVPNRHASLHGIVTYSTMKNSVNALIMTDFIFHVVSQIKQLAKASPSGTKAPAP